MVHGAKIRPLRPVWDKAAVLREAAVQFWLEQRPQNDVIPAELSESRDLGATLVNLAK